MAKNTGHEKEYSLVPFFESSPDFLCIAGFDGYFKRINPALCELLEYSEEELFQRPINDFVHPDDQQLTEQHRKNLREGKPLLKFENRYITKSGDVVWLAWTSIPRVEDQLVYAIAKDITHLKQVEANRDKVLAELTQTNDHLKKLNYSTVHDLRAPLTNLLLLFQMLDTESISDPEVIQHINLLKEESHKIKEKIDRYVDHIKENNSPQHKTRSIRFSEVYESVIESLNQYVLESGTVFETHFENCPTVEFNEVYLESIFLNLISNAIKYAHPDRKPIINIETRKRGDKKQLVFTDNGIGLDIKSKEKSMFELGSHFSEQSDSKGIGLYLIHNYMASMGGWIEVSSTPGKGSTFILTFPTLK
ncbi:MAG: sensor histidine kinase [Bacteroidota bacterium]